MAPWWWRWAVGPVLRALWRWVLRPVLLVLWWPLPRRFKRWLAGRFRGVTHEEAWGYAVWSLVALTIAVPELTAAIDDKAPWPTISGTVGELEWVWSPTSIIVVALIVFAAANAVRNPLRHASGVEVHGRRGRTGGGRFTAKPDHPASAALVSPYWYFPLAIAFVIVGSVIAAERASGQFDLAYVLYPLIGFWCLIVPSLLALFRAWDVPFPTLFLTIANLERRLHFVGLVVLAGLVILLIHLAFYPWPDISHVLQTHHPKPSSK
jgi:hypothetical protein